MSPLEQIKKGILSNNMADVEAGYLALTGESWTKKNESKKRGRPPGKAKLKPKDRPKNAKIIIPNDAGVLTFQKTEEDNVLTKDLVEQEISKIKDNTTEEPSVGMRIQASRKSYQPKTMKFFTGNGIIDKETPTEKKAFEAIAKSFKATERRPPQKMGKIKCAVCKKLKELPWDEIKNYGDGSENSELPTFNCSGCIR